MKSLIKDDKKYTIFAPSDEAMKKFVGNSSAEVLGNIAEIIKYHIVPRSLQTCEFENDMLLDTLDGENKIRINVYNYGKVSDAFLPFTLFKFNSNPSPYLS